MKNKILLIIVLASMVVVVSFAKQREITDKVWSIGVLDSSSADLALGPNGFRLFLANDFGYEDKFYLVGYSNEKKDFPYILPGPTDTWGGTWPTSGWRTHQVNILFGLNEVPSKGDWKLVINLLDYAKIFLPLVKVSINTQDEKVQLGSKESLAIQPKANSQEPIVDTLSISGDLRNATKYAIEIPIDVKTLKKGNQITITVLEGSWIMFDEIHLEGPKGTKVAKENGFFIHDVYPASYELKMNNKKVQPMIIDAQSFVKNSAISVELDQQKIFSETIEDGMYQLEIPMPQVMDYQESSYRILRDGVEIDKGKIMRSPQKTQTYADYVDTRIGTAHSRWMIAPGPWMPFSMVKMSPDNQNSGWQAGYQPSFESIGCFSHIHEWTMGGLGVMPTNGELKTNVGDEQEPDSGYRSRINKRTETANIGYYAVDLLDYGIKAEVTATTRCGFERFTFPENKEGARIMIDLHPPTEYGFQLKDIELLKINDYRIEGSVHQFSGNVWSNDADQDYTIHFVMEFDQPIVNMGRWIDKEVKHNVQDLITGACKDAGVFVEFDPKKSPVVQVRSGISLVSRSNADLNLRTELADKFEWSFDRVRQNQVDVWNDIFNRVAITTTNRLEKVRFYNNMYRAVCSRNIWSDVNGEWVGTDLKVHRVSDPDNDVMIGCDAFWNTFWNLNQFWNLVTPEWSSKWVRSQLAMYDAYGWLAKGPAGLNYIPVMVAEHEIPLIVGAYQMGIRDFDADKALEAIKKMQTTPAQKVFNGFAGNRDLVHYMKYKYVPSDLGRFSNTMEYSYDDWTVGQLAKAMGKNDDYEKFNERGYWWKNVISKEGYCHLKDSNGKWMENFDPFRSGANHHYVEGNAWQLTFFVPQDVPALVSIIGKERFLSRLEWGFNQDEAWRYNAPNDQYWDHPIVQGNQQSMHFAFLFNWAGKPWLTQKWTRSILEHYYGYGVSNAYLGDEDQGQMSAWAVMASIGLFQIDGGTKVNPVYEVASPLFEKIEIDLGERYNRGKQFVIEAKGASKRNMYIQKATLNGKELNSFYFPASELLKGGNLILEMGDKPNMNWGINLNDISLGN